MVDRPFHYPIREAGLRANAGAENFRIVCANLHQGLWLQKRMTDLKIWYQGKCLFPNVKLLKPEKMLCKFSYVPNGRPLTTAGYDQAGMDSRRRFVWRDYTASAST